MDKSFGAALLRLKSALGLHTDKEVAELLGMGEKAFNARKARNSFPADKVFALQSRRPDLRLDADFVINGAVVVEVKAAPIDAALHAKSVEAVMAELQRRGVQLDADVRPRVYRALHDLSLPGPEVNAKALSALLDVALATHGNYSAQEPRRSHQTTFRGEVGSVHTVHEGSMSVTHKGPAKRSRNPPRG